MTRPAENSARQAPGARLAPWAELAQRATQCGRLLRARIAVHAEAEGLAETEFFVLWACRQPAQQGRPQCELAVEVGISPAQVSGLVDRLRRQSLLVGCRDDRDRRRQRWQATDAGDALLERVLARLESWLTIAERQLSHEHVRSLAESLAGLQQLLDVTGQAPIELRIFSPDVDGQEATR